MTMIAARLGVRALNLLADRCEIWKGSTVEEARPKFVRFAGVPEDRIFQHLTTKIGGFGPVVTREICQALEIPLPEKGFSLTEDDLLVFEDGVLPTGELRELIRVYRLARAVWARGVPKR
jgi:hypothetical protein